MRNAIFLIQVFLLLSNLSDAAAAQETKKVRVGYHLSAFAKAISGLLKTKAYLRSMDSMSSRSFSAAVNWQFKLWPAAIRR